MNKEQTKYWLNMLDLINKFRKEEITFSMMVNDLEGILDASEIQDVAIKRKWYDLWQPFEIQNALYGNEVDKKNIKKELNIFENFILGQLE